MLRIAIARYLRKLKAGVLNAEGAPHALAFLRIGIATVLLVQAAIIFPHLEFLYGKYAIIQQVINDAIVLKGLPTLTDIYTLAKHVGVADVAALHTVFGLHVLSLCALLIGYRTRAAATIALLTDCVLVNGSGFTVYGFSSFARVGLFYCVLFPVATVLSLKPQTTRQANTSVGLRMLQLHVLIVYLSSGMEKASGEQWWNGEAMWRSLMQPVFTDMSWAWLAEYPVAAQVMAIGTLVVEAGYPFFAVAGAARAWAWVVVVLHVCIGAILGLRMFAAVMVVFNVCAFLHREILLLAAVVVRAFGTVRPRGHAAQ